MSPTERGPVVLYLLPLADPLRRQGIDRPALRRLRQALKVLRRAYGLKCVLLRDPTGWELDAVNSRVPSSQFQVPS